MTLNQVRDAIELLEKGNAGLEPELLTASDARELLSAYARAERLAAFGIAALARKLDDVHEISRVTGTSVGKARDTVATGRVLAASPELNAALQRADISLDQAAEIARAEGSAPGSADELVKVATEAPFHVLKERSRKLKLEAEQHQDLAARQHAARRARSHGDELGMVHIHLELEPHAGAPIVARAEAEAQRRVRTARSHGTPEPFERHLADAYAALLAGSGRGRARRPELVVLVSHEIATRGWSDVGAGEVCKIPGIGPVAPGVAKEIANDAFLNGVFYDGTDLRRLKRWSRDIPVEVRLALELGEGPGFDGIACTDCGNHFRTELDHVRPHSAGGPTSTGNLKPRCHGCHKAKTKRDRRAGKHQPAEP